jgi:oligopeptide/dipeptide ABC transporter ATP-binding protein
MPDPLLEVRNLRMEFAMGRSLAGRLRRRPVEMLHALDGIDLAVDTGEALGIVGESGCGKSTLGRCVVGLCAPTAGEILYRGATLPSSRKPSERRHIQMVFQDPYSSLDPRMTARQALRELLKVHGMVPPARIDERCAELVELVGLGTRVLGAYPRQLSGGQRQRVAIARALALEPDLLIADEPVSALDVSVQATVLNLLKEVRSRLGQTMVFITHNLAVVPHVCDRVAVMYLGRIVEIGPTGDLFREPLHPYTRGLLAAVPKVHREEALAYATVAGDPPSPVHLPSGCRFHPRCPDAQGVCRELEPELALLPGTTGRAVACHMCTASGDGNALMRSRAETVEHDGA